MKIIKQCEICGYNLDEYGKCNCCNHAQFINKIHELNSFSSQMSDFQLKTIDISIEDFKNQAKKFMYYYYKANTLIYKYYLDENIILFKELTKIDVLFLEFKRICILHSDSYIEIIQRVQATDAYSEMIKYRTMFYDKRGLVNEQ